jgi:hypothetical protein
MNRRIVQQTAATALLVAVLAAGLPGLAAAPPAPGAPGAWAGAWIWLTDLWQALAAPAGEDGGQTTGGTEGDVDLSGSGDQGAGLDPNGGR